MTTGAMPRLPLAACRTSEGERLFLYGDGRNVGACKAICAGCPERRECLLWGVLHEGQWGIWGGLTADELTAVRAQYGIQLDQLRAEIRATPSTPKRQTFAAANAARLGSSL